MCRNLNKLNTTSNSIDRNVFYIENIFMKKNFFVYISIILVFTSCVTTNKNTDLDFLSDFNAETLVTDEIQFTKINDSAEYALLENKIYRQKVHLVKINLLSENIKLEAYPNETVSYSLKNGRKYFTPVSTKDFAKKQNAFAAINTTPFEYKNIFLKRTICGTHKASGNEYGIIENRYCALCFNCKGKDRKLISECRIIRNQTETELEKYDFCFGGFFVILENGCVEEKYKNIKDARVAAGLADGGKVLYLMEVEGGTFSKFCGLSYSDCAKIFKALGCSDAMQFDGGNSSQLVLEGRTLSKVFMRVKQAAFLGFSQ